MYTGAIQITTLAMFLLPSLGMSQQNQATVSDGLFVECSQRLQNKPGESGSGELAGSFAGREPGELPESTHAVAIIKYV